MEFNGCEADADVVPAYWSPMNRNVSHWFIRISERTKLTGLLGVVAVLLCIGFVFSVRLTSQINHAAQTERPAAAAQAQTAPPTRHG